LFQDALQIKKAMRKAQSAAGVSPRPGFATPRMAFLAATRRERGENNATRRCAPRPDTQSGRRPAPGLALFSPLSHLEQIVLTGPRPHEAPQMNTVMPDDATRPIPKISVGMPVYNGERYLSSAIESVLNQSFGDFELIIADNASTDHTEAICREYALRDSRIRYIRNKVNIGAAGNYNLLFEQARAKYFRWFNADDLSSPRLHELCYEALEANPSASMAYGKTDLIDGEGELIDHYDDQLDLRQISAYERLKEFFLRVGQTNAIYGLMRSSALKRTSLMGRGSFPAADTNLMGEMAIHGQIVEISETLFFRRIHEGASSWNRSDRAAQQKFWKGRDAKFTLPTLKCELAYWWAVGRSNVSFKEKQKMRFLVARRIWWSREDILTELGFMLTAKDGSKEIQ
jgi:glycosyltransferase involved in cell wall biosynthesis